MEKVFTSGQTTEFMKENGDQIKCMVKVLSHGPTVENMLVSMRKIKKEVTVSLYGQMEDATEVNGSMENNMEKEHMSHQMVRKNMENGRMEKE